MYDDAPAIEPKMCVNYRDGIKCMGCALDKEQCWSKRKKSPHGGYTHEWVDVDFVGAEWSPSTPDEVKDIFKK